MSASADSVKVFHMYMLSNMKIRTIAAAAVAALTVLFGCSGNVDTSSLPVLQASDTEIDLASETQTVFTVTYNGEDVTSAAEILSSVPAAEFDGRVYKPLATGSAVFYAKYNGLTSNEVTVNVIDSDPQVETRFRKHTCVMEFTGASCAFCPAGYDNLMLQLSKPAFSKYKKQIHICAFHSEEMGIDTLAIPATMDVKGMFNGLDLPSFAIDMRDAGGLNSDGISSFNTALKAALEQHQPYCGVAVSSVVSPDGKTADVTVKVASEYTAEYRAVVLVVQTGIVGYQKHGTYGELNDYTHNHVVRKVVTEYTRTFTGEKLTAQGKIAAGEEKSRTWTIDIAKEWVLANTEVYAIVLGPDGYVNNMNVCHIDGGASEYDLK